MALRLAAADPTHPVAANPPEPPTDEEALATVLEAFPEASVVETVHPNGA